MRSRVAIIIPILLLSLALPAAVGAEESQRQPPVRTSADDGLLDAGADRQRDGARLRQDLVGQVRAEGQAGRWWWWFERGHGRLVDGNGIVEKQSGRILFTMGGIDYICSGSVVDSGNDATYSTVLSAGHCVYDWRRRLGDELDVHPGLR